MAGKYNRIMKTLEEHDTPSPSSDDDDDMSPPPPKSAPWKARRSTRRTTAVSGGGGPKKGMGNPSTPSFSSDDNQSSEDEFQPSSDDLRSQSCSSSDHEPEPFPSSDESSQRSSSSSDVDIKSPTSSSDDDFKSSSDDDAIPPPKSAPRNSSNRVLRSTTLTSAPKPQKRLRKASAVLTSSSSSDDDAIPPSKKSPTTSDSSLTNHLGQFKKPRAVVAPTLPPPPVPIKQTKVARMSLSTPTFMPPLAKRTKLNPIPSPPVLTSNQMYSAVWSVSKGQPTPGLVAVTHMPLPPPPPPPPSKPSSSISPSLTSKSVDLVCLEEDDDDDASTSSTSTSNSGYHSQPVSLMSAKILQEISPVDFTDQFLQSGVFEAKLVVPCDPEFTMISDYVINGQAHQGFRMNLDRILEINRPSAPSPPVFNPPKFTMMLWHGTKPQNVAAILENGFRCPATGVQMFGQGIYFADRISKSAQYCSRLHNFTRPVAGEDGYLFLCEVVIGKSYNARVSNPTYKAVPTATRRNGSLMTFDSVMCTGENVPDRSVQKEIDGVVWPVGPTVRNTKFQNYTVQYNEYIVYDPEMVKIKYLVKVNFV